jgi:hypothetical protein
MRKKYWVILVLLGIALAGAYFLVSDFVLDEPERRATDHDFIMLDNTPSPNQKYRILIYHYDNGAFGYSRTFWAVTPFEYQNLNLANYEIPDGYQAKGWSAENDLLVEKWEPYYYRQKLGELRTGDLFKGVRVKLIESAQNKSEAK